MKDNKLDNILKLKTLRILKNQNHKGIIHNYTFDFHSIQVCFQPFQVKYQVEETSDGKDVNKLWPEEDRICWWKKQNGIIEELGKKAMWELLSLLSSNFCLCQLSKNIKQTTNWTYTRSKRCILSHLTDILQPVVVPVFYNYLKGWPSASVTIPHLLMNAKNTRMILKDELARVSQFPTF